MRYLLVFLFSLFSFYAQAHVGLPLSEGLKASVTTDGINLNNQTGHTIKLHKVTCDGKKISIRRIRANIEQPVNFVVIPDGRKVLVAPPNYRLQSLHNCKKIQLNFGPEGNFKAR
ncbi:MAG: hypothetical protein ACK5LE_09565 [Alphaproteobacteria bacterium]